MPNLHNSSRSFLKATYSRIDPGVSTRDEPLAIDRLAFARHIAIQSSEASELADRFAGNQRMLRSLEVANRAVAGPQSAVAAAALAGQIPADDLVRFARTVDEIRSENGSPGLGDQVDRFIERRKVEPVAWLHLERIETTPIGIERGELVATVPMAPGEKVFVSHKEWATTSNELHDIVQDELETYSEIGVAEKSDVAMSNESEVKRDLTLNFGVNATGSYGPVSMTTSFQLSSAESERETRSASTKHALEQTRKASSRVRKEHKVSMRVETRTGTEDLAAKEIVNSSDHPIRIDYYRMMRKWRVDLVRYGLRMTYDLVVPDPGACLRIQSAEIEALRTQLAPFVFDLPRDAITTEALPGHTRPRYLELADDDRYDTKVPLAPASMLVVHLDEQPQVGPGWHFHQARVNLPDGYEIESLRIVAHVGTIDDKGIVFGIEGTGYEVPFPHPIRNHVIDSENWSGLARFVGAVGSQTITLFFQDAAVASVSIDATCKPTAATYDQWQEGVWESLYAAAQSRHYARQQDIAGKIADLEAALERDDTLSLRRAEREEIMKATLEWLLGPGFDTTPDELEEVLSDPSSLHGWREGREFGEFVKFIHHAVEWENVLYFLYPYFWGSEILAKQKQFLWHSDPGRREFIRAGAARVVLPVRPGFETAFACFMEDGIATGPGSETGYYSIAREMQDFARTNYAGIPPANPDVQARARATLTILQQQAWDDIQVLVRAVEAYATARKQAEAPGWEGAPFEPRYYPSAEEGLAVVAALPGRGPLPLVDPWGRDYEYTTPGRTAPFVIRSLGADGQPGGEGDDAEISTDAEGNLIATWFEYTPSSGIDIEVDTDAAKLA